MKHLVIQTIISFFLIAVTAQAQVTTSDVSVKVTGTRCSDLKDLYLVVNGDDQDARRVKLKPEGNCDWKVDLGANTISTSVARFSLRGYFVDGGIARFDCQKAAANQSTAKLEFACCGKGPFRNVGVKVEPSMSVSYVRDVRPFPDDTVPGVKCYERATFDEGEGAISHAQFFGEDIYLHLGPADRKRPTLGLLLNDVVSDDGRVILTPDGVVYRLVVQRAKGKQRSAPTLSSNAISLDIKKLGELKLERAEIEVIK